MYYFSSYRTTFSTTFNRDNFFNIDSDESLLDIIKSDSIFLRALYFSNKAIYHQLIDNKITKNLQQALFRYYCRYCFRNVPNNFWAYSIPINNTFERSLEPSYYRIEKIKKLEIQELNIRQCKVKVNNVVMKKLDSYFMVTPVDIEDEIWKLEATPYIDQIYSAAQEWVCTDALYEKTTGYSYEEFIESLRKLVHIKFMLVKIAGKKYTHSIADIGKEKFLESSIDDLSKLIGDENSKLGRDSYFINTYTYDSYIKQNIPKINIQDIRMIISLFTLSDLRNEIQIEGIISEILDEKYGIESIVPVLELIKNPQFKYVEQVLNKRDIKFARKYVGILQNKGDVFGRFEDMNEYEYHLSKLSIHDLQLEQRALIYKDIAHMHFNRMVGIYSDFDERLINNSAIYKVCEDIRRHDD